MNNSLGVFDSSDDIGDVGASGAARANGSDYEVTGSGQNIWLAEDAFHYVWKKIDGDATLTAEIAFVGEGVDAHRKGCLMVRQSLDADSANADIALHGDGLTSLQYRLEKGAETLEYQSTTTWPKSVGLEIRGSTVTAIVNGLAQADTTELALSAPYYIGLAMSSHARGVLETAIFSNVTLETSASE